MRNSGIYDYAHSFFVKDFQSDALYYNSITKHGLTQISKKNAQYTIYRFISIKNTILANLVWKLLQSFHEDRLIIQGRSMHIMFFDIMAILIRIVVALTRCEGHFAEI